MRNTDPGTGACPDDRQGHPHRRPAGPCDDGDKFADDLPLYRQENIFGRAGRPSPARRWRSGSGKPAYTFSLWSNALREAMLAERVIDAYLRNACADARARAEEDSSSLRLGL